MTFVTSQALFKVTQEFLTLTATQPAVHASVECFNVAPKNLPGSIPARTQSPPVPTPLGFGLPWGDSPSAPPNHFPALTTAFSAAFPDFDFSMVSPWNFKLISAPEQAQANVNWAFQMRLADCEPVLTNLWITLEKEISPATCSIYVYEPDRPDGFSECGAVFNMCYFYLNEKTNKVVLVHLREGGRDFNSDDEDDDGDLEDRYGFSVF
jgi:hypothetical protein